MSKTIRIGVADLGYGTADLFCKIVFDDGKLSITGVEGPKANGDCKGSCGQIIMHPWVIVEYAPGWNADLVSKFRSVWQEWHLNDMQAGTPAQTAFLKENRADYPGHPVSHYEWAKIALKEARLDPDPDNGYSYGSAWLKVKVPEDVLKFLESLPEADIQPAWV